MDNFDYGYCIEGYTPHFFCIPNDLVDAWRDHAATVETDFTLGELFRDALISFLDSIDKLPDPYV